MDQIRNQVVERVKSLETTLSSEGGAGFQKALSEEMHELFPGLYSGKVSSGAVKEKSTIQEEIQADPERKRLYESAQEFQSIFLNMMLKSMRSSLNKKDDLLYGGNKQDIFEDMLYNEYSRAMSKSPGFDLADRIYEDLARRLPPISSEGKKVKSEYEQNMQRLDGNVSTDKKKNPWEWSY